MLHPLLLAASLALLQAPASVRVPVWRVDPSHSELSFTIRHLAGRVRGTIAIWQGDIAADPANLGRSAVAVNAYPGSIDTGNRERDEHLRGPDFFDVTTWPTITFKSVAVRASGNRMKITGDLVIRGNSKRVDLDGQLSGITKKDAKGLRRVAFLATTKIDRRDFGLSWNQFIEGAAMLGDEVDVEIAIEAVEAGTREFAAPP
jgi:polyisoprenoid-binding protein YceI